MERRPKQKMDLECILTAEEKIAYGEQLSSANRRKSSLEDEKKYVVSKFKAQIDECDADIGRLSGIISTGKEVREIMCETHYNTPEPGYKTVLRLDTMEKVSVKAMSADELQDLFINGLGERDGEDGKLVFIFRNHTELPIVAADSEEAKDGKSWKPLCNPLPAEKLVDEHLPKDAVLRVLKGEQDGKTLYRLYREEAAAQEETDPAAAAETTDKPKRGRKPKEEAAAGTSKESAATAAPAPEMPAAPIPPAEPATEAPQIPEPLPEKPEDPPKVAGKASFYAVMKGEGVSEADLDKLFGEVIGKTYEQWAETMGADIVKAIMYNPEKRAKFIAHVKDRLKQAA